MRFLITGLPRSRTAWLSVMAGMIGAPCEHEPLGWLERWEDACEIPGGVSDSGLGFHLAEILERCGPRVLIVMRPLDEVAASLVRFGFPPVNGLLELLRARIEECRGHPLVRIVRFSDLSDVGVVHGALEHIAPGVSIDDELVERMQHMNIQADRKTVAEIAARRAEDVAALLGEDVARLVGDAPCRS